MYPSRSVYRVVLCTDRILHHELLKSSGKPPSSSLFFQTLLVIVCHACAADKLVFEELLGHDSIADPHRYHLVRATAAKFLKATLGHLGKTFAAQVVGAATNKRNKATRSIIFKGL